MIYSINFVQAQSCKFDKNGYKSVPWGHIRNSIDAGKVTKIKGTITAADEEPILTAQIVLYKFLKEKKIYVGSQEPNKKGEFCFGNLTKGTYVLEIGAGGFNSLEVELELAPKDKKAAGNLQISLEVGT